MKTVTVASAALLTLAATAAAQDQQLGARTKAMGGSYTAFEDDPVSVWLNPAGIATQPDQLSVAYQTYTAYPKGRNRGPGDFRGEEKTFTGDRTTLQAKRKHVSIRLAPTGRRVTFAKESIQNFGEVEAALRQLPVLSAEKARIAAYHKKHGGTSPRFEALRRKYSHLSSMGALRI